jgi:hypothetical protein
MTNQPADRSSFSLKRKKWWLDRDGHKCQASFEHICDPDHLQVHHILPHAYLHQVAPGVEPDYPENGITLCRTAHEIIHPDAHWARENYHLDSESFVHVRKLRDKLMAQGQIYWNDEFDRSLSVIALINSRNYETPFPAFKKRLKK